MDSCKIKVKNEHINIIKQNKLKSIMLKENKNKEIELVLIPISLLLQ